MNRIATLVVTLLLSLGLFAAPAHSEEPAPAPTCEETVQEWQARALAAEAELEGYKTLSGRLNELLATEKQNVANATETIERLSRIANRRADKLEKLRKQIRQLRREAR